VAGVVLDVNNARVARATVTIESKGFSKALITGDSGEFEASLPAGEYWFTVDANGFCKFESELLRVRPNMTEMMNVHLEVMVMDGPPDGCKCSSRSRKRANPSSRGTAMIRLEIGHFNLKCNFSSKSAFTTTVNSESITFTLFNKCRKYAKNQLPIVR
jgi:hypothetical protein